MSDKPPSHRPARATTPDSRRFRVVRLPADDGPPPEPGKGTILSPATSGTPAPVGDAIGPYAVLDTIGQGGMGSVFRARDPDLGRDLALKVLRDDCLDQPDLVRRFVEEAQIAGQLEHPGVPPVHRLELAPGGRPYFTMKLVQGSTLATLLHQRPSLSHELPRFLQVFEQVCQTVAYAHSKGVVHRDLKPANIMVGAFGEVQVMDWGLAKVLREPRGDETAVAPSSQSEVRTVRSGLTGLESQAGTVMGTPAYMAPEQARGQIEQVDARADVFGLGAVLCEVLTGEPPYVGPDTTATYELAARGDLAEAFARLDHCGVDAELVVLAKCCLAAEPDDRPIDGAAVAAAVTAYRAGVEDRLRQAHVREEAARARANSERTARRLTLWLAVVLVLLVAGAVWNNVRLWRQQSQQRQAVEADLDLAAQLEKEGALAEAEAAARRAEGRLSGGGPADLGERVQETLAGLARGRADRAMAARLDDIRMEAAAPARDKLARGPIGKQYAEAFAVYGMDRATTGAEKAARLVAASAIRDRLRAALDDWCFAENRKEPGRDWARDVLRHADDDPWRQRLREAAEKDDRDKLEELAALPEAATLPAETADVLATALLRAGATAAAEKVLGNAYERSVNNFWIVFRLAVCLGDQGPDRIEAAIGYARAAVALRPSSATAHVTLAVMLAKARQFGKAEQSFRRALDLDGDHSGAWWNLGICYREQGRKADAVAALSNYVRIRPKDASRHFNLAGVQIEAGDLKGAEASYRQAIELGPHVVAYRNNLGSFLSKQGRFEEAVSVLREAVKVKKDHAPAWHNLARSLAQLRRWPEAIEAMQELLKLKADDPRLWHDLGAMYCVQGKFPEGAEAFRQAIARKGDYVPARVNLGKLLLQGGQPTEAERHLRQALRTEPAPATFALLGESLLAQERWDEARTAFREATQKNRDEHRGHLGLCMVALNEGKYADAEVSAKEALRVRPDDAPALCNLALALRGQGKAKEALATMRQGHERRSRQPHWSFPSAAWLRSLETWQRLEPEVILATAGRDGPKDAEDRAALARLCLARGHFATSARLYASAFADRPALTDKGDDQRTQAAFAAAAAGCGQGPEGAKLPDKDRERLRQQALTWLRADLDALHKLPPAASGQVAATLQFWRAAPPLAGVRGAPIERLPEAERAAWRKLWADVEATLEK